MSIYVNCYLD